MPKQGRRAGQNIRELALKRRINAVLSFASAGLIVGIPILLLPTFNDFLTQTLPNDSSQAERTLSIFLIFYMLLAAMALSLVLNGIFLWKRANHADQGAQGEEDVSRELSQLKPLGWEIEYGLRLGNKLGDADIVCISPQGKAYVIDVKSHKGDVIVEGEQLHRRMGRTIYSFEKNFIDQVIQQALQVRRQKNLDFVTPILAFSKAKVLVPSNRLRKVYVVEKSRLLSLLKSLG